MHYIGVHTAVIGLRAQITARECIQYLKEQRYEQETFLPVSYINIQPINEALRSVLLLIAHVE